jgi:ribosome-binding factor A
MSLGCPVAIVGPGAGTLDGMPQGSRTERVGEEFREILAEEIQRLKDPRVGFVTVTGVRVSPDLRVAWVFYTAYGDERSRAASRAALRSASSHLRHELGRQIHLKVTPELRFEEDEVAVAGDRVDEIIHRLHHETDADAGGVSR